MKKIYAIAASLMLLSPFVAQAQTPSTPVLDQRQANQEQRIQQPEMVSLPGDQQQNRQEYNLFHGQQQKQQVQKMKQWLKSLF